MKAHSIMKTTFKGAINMTKIMKMKITNKEQNKMIIIEFILKVEDS